MRKENVIAPGTPVLREEEIREYAYHLFEQSGRAPGHDLDNWLEAEACLRANIRRQDTHTRLHQNRARPSPEVQSLADYRI